MKYDPLVEEIQDLKTENRDLMAALAAIHDRARSYDQAFNDATKRYARLAEMAEEALLKARAKHAKA